MSLTQAESQIQLRRMPQLAEAVDPEDDWTGVTDAASRRRRQNRLNVRAYRRRKARESLSHPTPVPPYTTEPGIPCWVEDQQSVLRLPVSVAKALSHSRTLLVPKSSTPTKLDRVVLPLSSDHLIPLLQFNVLRGLLVNRHLLTRLQPDAPHSQDCSAEPLRVLSDMAPSLLRSLPPSLHPTTLQRTVLHEDWIDIVPHPAWRDNLILASGTFDEDELWSDTIGGLFEGFPASEIEQRGVVLWSPPWHVSGWEVSEGFWRKWGWLLNGCAEILEATNRRRKERGEEPLASEICW